MNFGIKPLEDRVVIKKLQAEEKTASGIVLPGQAKEVPQIAEVIAVGPGTDEVTMSVKKGDKVIFSQYAGTEVKYEGETYIIVPAGDRKSVV